MSPETLMVIGLVLEVVLGALGFLVVRSVFGKLDEIAADVKEVRSKVDDHASRLATIEARIEEMRRRADETAGAVNTINTNGCARGCRYSGRET